MKTHLIYIGIVVSTLVFLGWFMTNKNKEMENLKSELKECIAYNTTIDTKAINVAYDALMAERFATKMKIERDSIQLILDDCK